MSTFLTNSRYAQTVTIPICLPQMEIRRGSTLNVGTFALLAGQRAEVRSLNLAIVRLFTPGTVVSEINKPYGLASLGIYDDDQMLCSPVIGVHAHELGTFALNPNIRHTLISPCVYRIVVTNNTGLTYDTALDFAVVVTGCIQIRTNTDREGGQAASTVTFGVPASATTTTATVVTETVVTTPSTPSTPPPVTPPPATPPPDDGGGGGGCPAVWQMVQTQESGWIKAGDVKVGMHLRGIKTDWTKVYGIRIVSAPIWRCVINNVEIFDVDANHAWLMPDGSWKSIQKLKTGDKIKAATGTGTGTITALYFLKRGDYAHLTVEGQHYAMSAYGAHNAPPGIYYKF